MSVAQLPLFDLNDKELIIKKHSSLIHVNNYKTAMQRKLMDAMILVAKKTLEVYQTTGLFHVNLGTLKKLAGVRTHNNEKLKDCIRQLKKIDLEYNLLQKDKEQWGIFSFLSEAHITIGGVGRDSFIQFSFPSIILEAIRYPQIYARLNLTIIRNLDGKHSIALYETLKDYQNIKKLKLSLEKFRALMGVEEGKYSVFTMLKKRVIDKAVQEVNAKTDLKIDYQLYKEGKRIAFIEFRIQAQKVAVTAVNENFLLEEKLRYFGFREQQIQRFLTHYSEDYLRAQIKLTEAAIQAKTIKTSPLRYLASAIQNDYRPVLSSQEKERIKQKKERKQQQAQAQLAAQIETELKQDFLRVKAQKLQEAQEGLSPQQLAQLNAAFEEKFAQSNLASMNVNGLEKLKDIQKQQFLEKQLLAP